MSKAREGKAVEAADEPAGREVADYLRRHPDFLERHPDLLEVLMPPSRWSGDGVVDMQRFMLERLRQEIDNLRTCATELIATSRVNMGTQNRTHAAALALLGADDFPALVRIVVEDLPLLLGVDAVGLAFEPPARLIKALIHSDIRRLDDGMVDDLLGHSRDSMLVKTVEDDGTLFGPAASLVRSAAIARLRPGRAMPPGLLLLGSREDGTFHPGQASDLVEFLGRVVERCVHQCLEPAA
jgi:uncharacterized protein YigA (DUF484 family)